MPDRYRRLPADTDLRVPYTITLGLIEGYGTGRRADAAEAVAAHSEWMIQQITAGQPYLTGIFTEGHLSYAWPRPEQGGGGHAEVEPALVFSGDRSVLYQPHLAGEHAAPLLDELASRMASALKQVRAYVTWGGRAWVIERVDGDA